MRPVIRINRRGLIWFVIAPLLCGVIPLVCCSFADLFAVSSIGSETLLWAKIILVFPALAAMVVFCVSLLGLVFRPIRFISGVGALCSLGFVAGFILSIFVSEKIRINAFRRLAERSEPLVAAIRAYEERYGKPPESLEALVPEFISSVPTTGMGAYPKYQYELTNKANQHGNPWIITIFTPSGGINFDQFMYWPLTNYPARGYGGWIERVGDWAYVHE